MITIVSGLPRSGTSMMMKILEAGGLAVLTDDFRGADEDNLKGYYEDERVKVLHEDNSWISEALLLSRLRSNLLGYPHLPHENRQ